MRQVEFVASTEGDRCAKYASCIFEHEVYLFCVYLFCSDDEVAFVFAIFVIYNNDKFTFLEILDCIFDAV